MDFVVLQAAGDMVAEVWVQLGHELYVTRVNHQPFPALVSLFAK